MVIDDYRFGCVVIDGKSYKEDLVILPDGVFSAWRRMSGHSLNPEDLDIVIQARPEVFIIGRGEMSFLRVPTKTAEFLKSHGIELIAEDTRRACELYNELSKAKRVACGLHLTC
ncbi:MAG: Mth938-like domain-containing protein [Candidatus Omnitrophica bacterium]|nr:Mth938-like domain-containing protein [Candidatus Omnitrophota bacterium]